MWTMTSPDLQTCLANLEHDACYRVVTTLKSSEFETTELVVYEPRESEANEPSADGSDAAEPGAAESSAAESGAAESEADEPNDPPIKHFIRKQIAHQINAGSAYELLYLAEKQGRVLECAPRVLDCYDIPGYQVVILEYLEGKTLDVWIAQHGAGEQTTRLLFPKLCDAVAHLHAAFDPALIHRDIKPSNIIILGDGPAADKAADAVADSAADKDTDDTAADAAEDPSVRLLDFGIARVFNEESDCDTHALGTRSYAPPEQFGFGQTDVRSDVYALGAVLYFMLTGATPQTSFSSQEKRDVFLHAANPALAQVIRKASAFDPQQRYQSVEELKAAFMQALPAVPPVVLPAAVVEPAPTASESNASTTPSLSAKEYSPAASASSVSLTASALPTSSASSSSSEKERIESGNDVGQGRIVVGVIWDVLVLLTLTLFIYGCVLSVVHPSETQATIPILNLSVASTGLGIMFVGIALMLLDVKPFVSYISVLKKYTIKKRLIIGLSVAVGGFLIMFVALGLAAFA